MREERTPNKPICLIVERATTFFKSISLKAQKEATKTEKTLKRKSLFS